MDALDKMMAERAARRAEADLHAAVCKAVAEKARAYEWPRCGDSWPKGRVEKAAQALLDANPALVEVLA